MAISDKKQLNVVSDQNDLIKEQLSLYKQINKTIDQNSKSISAIGTNIANDVKNLENIQDIEENIRKSLTIEKQLEGEISRLSLESATKHFESMQIGQTFNVALQKRLLYEASLIDIQKTGIEQSLKQLQIIRDINQNLQKLGELGELREHLVRKSEIANALGLSRYSSGITSFFNKLAILQGKNAEGAISVLNVLKEWYLPIVASYAILTKVVGLFNDLDKSAFSSRKELGMMREEHFVLRQQAEDLYKEYAHLGLTVDSVYKTQKSISLELGSTLLATKNIVEQSALLNAQFGIGEETTVKMLKTLGQMGQTTSEAQLKMVGFVVALSNAAGVPLPQVMDDIARSSETTRTMMSKVPLDMIKAAVEARRMGTTLDKMASSSRKLLNFTESMEAEMESSVLLGRPINLQLARQLAYNGKIAESNKEILKISKQINFDQLDPFQMEAYARATGKSVDELKNMLQVDREREQIIKTSLTNKSLEKQLKLLNELKRSTQVMAEAREKDFLTQVKQQQNQERLVSISNSWKRIVMEISSVFLPWIDMSLKFIADVLNNDVVRGTIKWSSWLIVAVGSLATIFGIVKSIGFILSSFNVTMGGVGNGLRSIVVSVGNLFKSLFSGIRTLGLFFSGMLSAVSRGIVSIGTSILRGFIIPVLNGVQTIGSFIIRGILSPVGKILASFAVGYWIGSLINKIESVQKFVQGFFLYVFEGWDWISEKASKVWNSIVLGLKSVTPDIFNFLKQPFVDVYDWIRKKLGGQSPSEIGLLIVDGIKAVESMLFNSLISPFKRAWEWISDMFGKINIQPSIERPIVNSKLSSIGVSMDNVMTDKEIKSYRELDNNSFNVENKQKSNLSQSSDSTDKLLSDMIVEIKGLRNEVGKGMTLNIDGQEISTVINRGNKFRGNFGAISG